MLAIFGDWVVYGPTVLSWLTLPGATVARAGRGREPLGRVLHGVSTRVSTSPVG